MNIEKKIFDTVVWFMALVALLVMLTGCSAAIDLPATATGDLPAQAGATAAPMSTRSTQIATAEPEQIHEATPQLETCTVQTGVPAGYLNLRIGAGTQYAVIHVLTEGEVLQVIERGAWLEVINEQGNQGFINGRYCR